MRHIIGDLIPLALVITLSPFNIVPCILLLFGARPKAKATSFLVAFVLGLSTTVTVLTLLADRLGFASTGGGHRWFSYVKIALGALLLFQAVVEFRDRPRGDEEGELPGWMDGLTTASLGRGFAVGLLLGAVNPKSIVMGIGAATTISESGLSSPHAVVAGLCFVIVASLGVAAPLVTVLLLGARSADVLHAWDHWLKHNHNVIMTVLFTILGAVLVTQGVLAT